MSLPVDDILETLNAQLPHLGIGRSFIGGYKWGEDRRSFKLNIMGDVLIRMRFEWDDSPMSADAGAIRVSFLDCAAEHNSQNVLYTFIGMDEFAARLHAYFSDHNCLLFK
jgi:hypothetical protein